jgi:hypothetical protein
MNYWKSVACTALLFPAMAIAQTGPGAPGAPGAGAPGAQQPGMQDRPGQTQPGMPGMARERGEQDYLTSLEQNHFLANDLIGQPVKSRAGGAGAAQAQPGQPGGGAQPGLGTQPGAGQAQGEEIATVKDIILSRDGQIEGILISLNGEGVTQRGIAAGLTERGEGGEVALRWDAVQLQRDPQDPDAYVVMVDKDRDELQQAPEFEQDREQQNGGGIFTR